ncbi:MAG: ankyrin repeat domain-containing protein [Brachymonas sp.]|nr:ankyrin repeat domain-containing protein [Brachymonas sp.]
MTTRHNQPHNPHPLQQPGQPEQTAGRADELVHLYRQALELVEREDAQPNPAVRAAVLAVAAQGVPETESGAEPNPLRQRPQLAGQTEQPPSCVDIEKSKADALAGHAASGAGCEMGRGAAVGDHAVSSVGTVAQRPANKRAAANDARWKIRALGGLATLGLVGLLASRFLPHTAGYAELAQTLPPAPYQQQAAPRPEAFSEQAQPAKQTEAHAHAAPADAPSPSPLPHAEQAAAAHAAAKTDQAAAVAAPSVRTAPANDAADDAADAPPLPVRRQATAPEPQAPAAKGKPLPRQQQQKTQQPDPQRVPGSQPLAVSRRPSAWQAPQPSAQPYRAEQAEAAAAAPFMRDVPERAITDQTAGDPLSNQMSVKRASQGAGGQAVEQGAEPFPLDAWPAAKGRSRSAAPPAPGGTAAAPGWQGAPAVVASPVQPRVQGGAPLAEPAQPEQSVVSAASDFSRDRVLMRRVPPEPEQAQETSQPTRPQHMQQARVPETVQEAVPEAAQAAMQAAGPRAPAQLKRGLFKQGQPASSTAFGQAAAADVAALFSAASRGDVAGVQRALQVGVAMDARDAAGRTALMHAAAHGHRSVVRHLLRHGADAGLVDHAGRDAAAHARLGGHEGLAQALSGKP